MGKKTCIPNWLFGINMDAEMKYVYLCLQHLAQQRKTTEIADTRTNVVAKVMAMGTWKKGEQVQSLIEGLRFAGPLVEIMHPWQHNESGEVVWTLRLIEPGPETLERLSPENRSLLCDEILDLARAYGCTFKEKARPGVGNGTDGIIVCGEGCTNIGPYETGDLSDARWWGRKQWQHTFELAVHAATNER